MKNKFGFIPIVLPVLVMVLIIGLINMTGPQNAQAQNPARIQITFLGSNAANGAVDASYQGIVDATDTADGVAATATRVLILATPEDYTLDDIEVLVQTESIRIIAEATDGEVSLNGVKLTEGSDATANDVRVLQLVEGSNDLVFTVFDDAQNKTTHRVKIIRQRSSAPEFVSDRIESESPWYFLINTTTNPDIPLPYATGGNGTRNYALYGVEPDGNLTTNLPEGFSSSTPLHATSTSPSTENNLPACTAPPCSGWLFDSDTSGGQTGPQLRDGSDLAQSHFRFVVTDSDGVDTAEDMDTIQFSVIVVRYQSQIPARPGAPGTDPAEEPGPITDIIVSYDASNSEYGSDLSAYDGPPAIAGGENSGSIERMTNTQVPALSPAFHKDTNSYLVMVPTDVRQVDIAAVATSTVKSVSINRIIDSTPDTDVPADNATESDRVETGYMAHEVTGLRIGRQERGSVNADNNIYDVVVVDADGNSMTYKINVVREIDYAPVFEDDSTLYLDYFEGIDADMMLPAATETSGNGTSTDRRYVLERTGQQAPDTAVFLGLCITGDATVADCSSPATITNDTSTARLLGTPQLDTDEGRPSDRSQVLARLSVHDSDKNTTTAGRVNREAGEIDFKDVDELDIQIQVWRDVSLESVTLDGIVDSTLGDKSTEVNEKNWDGEGFLSYHYDDDGLDYTFPLDYGSTSTTIAVGLRDDASATPAGTASSKIMSPHDEDADDTLGGYQIDGLQPGDNDVVISVQNGAVEARHTINVYVQPLVASALEVSVEEDLRSPDKSVIGDPIVLTPVFDSMVTSYTATVENYISEVRIKATPMPTTIGPTAVEVLINTIRVDPANGESFDLYTGRNDIEVKVRHNGVEESYNLVITRRGDEAPAFDGAVDVEDAYEVGKPLMIELPLATGGNGMLDYTINENDLTDYGLNYEETLDATTDEATGMMYSDSVVKAVIMGTPTLSQGSKAYIPVTYTVHDDDSNRASTDMDTRSFTLVLTTEDLSVVTPPDPDQPPAEYPPGQGPDTLKDLVVTYMQDSSGSLTKTAELEPAFDPQNPGPYMVVVPPDYSDVTVTATPSDDAAAITLNQLSINSGVKVDLPNPATIRVTAADESSYMEYMLQISPRTDTDPTFGAAANYRDQEFVVLRSVAIDMEFPEASGGNGELTYTLVDSNGLVPAGLSFNAETRTLSGTPRISGAANRVEYSMTYDATDENGDGASDPIMFTLTVCDGCDPTDPPGEEPNPGYTPMDLAVNMSSDGTSATLSWRPGDDATKQVVVALDPNDLLASAIATLAEIDAEANSYTIGGLTAGVNYIYIVLGYDANGNYKDADGNLYSARYVMQGN